MNIAYAAPHPQPRGKSPRGQYRVSHLGLPAREVLVIESMFRLHGDLQPRYAFVPTAAAGPADILFVDGDDPQALAEWRALAKRHPEIAGVVVSSNPAAATDDVVALPRPLSFRNLDEIRYALRTATPGGETGYEQAHGLQVLVVDDSASARELLQLRLEEAGNCSRFPLQVDVATSGEDALAKAADKAYDLVFLDIVLPGVDGYEVCRRLKQLRPTRVAMLSSCGKAADYQLGHAAGCDHYLAKPAPADMINTVVRLAEMKKTQPVR